MNRGRTAAIVIFILVVALLAFAAYRLVNRQPSSKPPTASPAASPKATPTPGPVSLLNYLASDGATVQFTIDGRVVAKEDHVSQTITIAKSHRDIDIFKDYSGTADPHNSYDNNQPAFEDFMRALQNAGFTSTRQNPKAADTEVGLCPFGQRYVYELIKDGETLFRSWSTTCSDPTDFTGNPATIRSLFQLQIPDYAKATAGAHL